ncbi:LRRN4 C-terminal-like protein isoform X2 [Micropterus dolomieu]|nr:LRRN4 C-terminal-like protein isoform X2 [Micropterus dolomieu]XP_045886288.1 LRRN4 C-terminal-like protein isoform X2 [Micropterus dolomieu]XP_045886289.1 LRRN4 C-terminal-like protein isoform X2 [Micropterus dolomieu]
MTSLYRNLAVLLLFTSPLLHSRLYTHAASTSPPVTRPRIIFMTDTGSDDDFDDEDDDYLDNHSSPPEVLYPGKTTFLQQAPELCQYNPCLENQEPCAQHSEKTGCLCPGISGADEPPHAPRIQMLLPVSEGEDTGKIEVQWCAPSSVVSGYRVVIEGSEGHDREFRDVSRRGVVGFLEVGTKVCVEAVNNAGHSTPSEFSCKRYDPPKSSNHNLLAWIIGGGVTLLLLLIIAAVLLWKYQMHQKAKKDSTDGLGNPSYSREGTL